MLHIITGDMCAGKSTLAHKLRDSYDLVIGTDIGKIGPRGTWVNPDKSASLCMREKQRADVMQALAEKRRVLIEGGPGLLLKQLRDSIPFASRIIHLVVPVDELVKRLLNRSIERDSSIMSDYEEFNRVRCSIDSWMNELEQLASVPIEKYRPSQVDNLERDLALSATDLQPSTLS